MKMIKKMIGSSVISMMMSSMIFMIVGMIYDRILGGRFLLEDYSFTKMGLACIATGLGFGVPTILYSMEKMPMSLAAVLHLGIGMTIYFIAASRVGWIPVDSGLIACVITIAAAVVVSLLIWFCFMKYYRNLADRMNQRLRTMNR